jgi:hypothetical protein
MTRFVADTLRDLGSDVRFVLRMARRQPVHAVASTLNLGIGATTAEFAVVDATLLRPLAYHAPERLVGLNGMMSGPHGRPMPYSLGQIELVRWRTARAFEYIESIEPGRMALTGSGDPGGRPGRPCLESLGYVLRGRVLTGIGIGVGVFLAVGRLVSSLLYNTSYADSRVLAGAVIPLSTVSMAVVYLRARQLASVSPVLALREDTSST